MRAGVGIVIAVLVAGCSGNGGTGGSGGGSAGGGTAGGAAGGTGGTGGSAGGSGGGSAGGTGGGTAGGSGGGMGGGSGGGTAGGGGSGMDGGADAGANANIQAALNCGTPIGLTGVAKASELQSYEVPAATFPRAQCNDGSPPVIYFRPYRGAANQNRWAISLRGGGTCGSAASCAARWCACNNLTRCPYASETTNFDLNNMSGGGARSINGGGVMLRDGGAAAPNPLEDYNQVQFIYCSSDLWKGDARGVPYTTTHPITGQPVTYVLHFLGASILDANLKILRQDGVPALSYTLGGGAIAMPDLDDALDVVLIGDSAGGAGVINNLDYVAGMLRQKHTGCDGGPACPPRVNGIIDAVVGPELSRLDWSTSKSSDAGIDTWAKAMTAVSQGAFNASGREEASCVAWHTTQVPNTQYACNDISHLIRHHVTTPFFVRMALLDQLISSNYEDLGVADPVLGKFTRNGMGVPLVFAGVLRRELDGFPNLPATAEEGAAFTQAPGVFGPACTNHDTIHTNTEVYGVTITTDAGVPTRFFDVFQPWRDGGTAAIQTRDPMRMDTICP